MCDDDFDEFAPLNKKKKTRKENENDAKTILKQPSGKARKKLATSGGKPKKSSSNRKVTNGGNCNKYASSRNEGLEIQRCPVCQMPLCLLRIESPEWHVTECLSSTTKAFEECPAGIKCNSPIENHYKKYKHTELADAQAVHGGTEDCNSSNDTNESGAIAEVSTQLSIDVDESSACTASSSRVGPEDGDLSHLTEENNGITYMYDSDEDIFGSGAIDHAADERETCVESVAPYGVQCGEINDETKDSDNELTDDARKQEMSSQDSEMIETDDLFDDVDDALLEAEGSDGCDDDDENGEANSLDDDVMVAEIEVSSTQLTRNGFAELNEEFPDIAESLGHLPTTDSNTTAFPTSSQFPFNRNTPEKSSSHPKAGLAISQSSILSFFGSPKHENKRSNLREPVVSSNSQNYNRSFEKPQKSLPDPLAAKAFMKQFNRTGNSTTVEKPAGGNYAIKTHNSGKNEEGSNGGKNYKRSCPFYKKIPGTTFTVDAFSYGTISGCSSYFLSHFHYDHYQGLNKRFMHPIYCSQVTANLVKKKLNVNPQYIHALKMNSPSRIDGVEVTLLEANHCPGSVLFLFSLPDGSNILHTGDFRADPSMELYPELHNISIKQLYLDTTYCDAAYAFPPQKDVIKATIDITRNHLHQNPNTLIAVGAYTIGKERIFLAIAEEFNCQICVTREKQRILECQDNSVVNKRMTTIAQGARLHVLPMKQLNFRDLSTYLDKFKGCYDNILAFEPTGWTHSRGASSNILKLEPKLSHNSITIYGVPYSEHSSFLELKRFVQWCQPQKIIPTVNVGSPSSRAKMDAYFKVWLSEKPSSQAKQTNLGTIFLAKNS